jgi:mannose-1-phosphate guanylyltransferase
MAGGSGERFWPLSRRRQPKQLLRIASATQTLLDQAVERILPLVPAEHVYISTTTLLEQAMRDAGLPVPAANVLAEPARRNTAGCLSWVAAELRHRYPGEDLSIAVLTADHLIGNAERFRGCVRVAMETAEAGDCIATLGVTPDRPETGYGYIEIPEGSTGSVVPVMRFREKPNQSLAENFVASGRHFWNSGMFFWRLNTFISQLEEVSPIHGSVIRGIAEALGRRDSDGARRLFETLPNISIDYALLERSEAVQMVRADFGWDDLGSWDALERSRPCDEAGNVVEGGPILKDVKSSIVINEAGAERMAVGVIGVENLVVIVTNDAVLVCPKDHAQEVRHVPRELDQQGRHQL